MPLLVGGIALAFSIVSGGRGRARFLLLGLTCVACGWSVDTVPGRPSPLLLADAPRGETRLLIDHPVEIEAQVGAGPQRVEDGVVVVARLLRVRRGRIDRPTRDPLRLWSRHALPPLIAGDRIRAWVVLRLPGTNVPRPVASVSRRGFTARLKSPRLLVAVRPGTPAAEAWLERVHRGLADGLDRGLARGGAGARTRALTAASILGDRERLEENDRRRFTDSGLVHLLAVSGLQMTVVAGGITMGLRMTGAPAGLASGATIAMIALYTLLLPVSASVGRAALMALPLPVARLVGRRGDSLNLLGGAALVLLAWDPALRSDPGFVLSFVATAALLQCSGGHLPADRVKGRLRTACLTSITVSLATVPMTAFFFGQAAPAAALLNLVAVPASSALVLIAAAATALGAVHPLLAAPAAPLAAACAHAIFMCAASAELPPFAAWRIPRGRPLLTLAAVAAVLALRLVPPRARLGAWMVVAVLQGLVLGGCMPPSPLPRHLLSLRAIDVGQGDALLVGLPDGGSLLVDGGGVPGTSFDTGREIVLPALAEAGVVRLSAVALSHPHVDHARGLGAVLEALPVDELWLPGLPPRDPLVLGLVQLAVDRGIAVRVLREGDRVRRGGALLTCLAPRRGPREGGNEDSLVLLISAPEGRILLPGDVTARGERRLIDGLQGQGATVLKVAHHGSRTSTTPEFLGAVRPRVAVISVGRSNPWEHPDAEVIARLRQRRVRILRTDRSGTVTVTLSNSGPIPTAEGPPVP